MNFAFLTISCGRFMSSNGSKYSQHCFSTKWFALEGLPDLARTGPHPLQMPAYPKTWQTEGFQTNREEWRSSECSCSSVVDRNVAFDCSCMLSAAHSLFLGKDVLICNGKNLLRLGGNGDPLSVCWRWKCAFLCRVWNACPLCCSPVWVEWTLLLGMPFGATCFQSRLWWARISWPAARIQTSCMNW